MHFRNTLLATALGQAALAQAVDWPQWRGPTRDGILPANGIMLTKLPDQPGVVWKIKSGEGLSSPVVADGTVFHFENARRSSMVAKCSPSAAEAPSTV
jgi:hypothetical protein